jgi:hypothetical protein
MVKIGDLVTPSPRLGCDLFTDEFAEVFPKDVENPYMDYEMRSGEIGTILEIKMLNTNTGDNLIKLLTQNGMGWVFSRWVKVISEPR